GIGDDLLSENGEPAGARDGDDEGDGAGEGAGSGARRERGVGLASIVPPENREEGPTTIINEAVQTHAPYEQRGAEVGGGVPPEHWVAPARREALTRAPEPRAPEPEELPPPTKKRRGLL